MSSLLLALVASSFAGSNYSPHATASDQDHDGVYAATVDVNGDGSKDYLDIEVAKNDYDCDDDHDSVSPKLAEVVGDGIDNDCSGADANWPTGVNDVIAKRFLANSGAKSAMAFIKEYDRCKVAVDECQIDSVGGTFKIKPDKRETHVFQDVHCKESDVLGTDGVREVVTREDASHWTGQTCKGVVKKTASGSSGSAGNGVSRKTVHKIADEAAGKAKDEAFAAIANTKQEVDDLEGVVNEHGEAIVTLGEGLSTEIDLRRDGDKEATKLANEAKVEAAVAIETAVSVASRSALFEIGAVGGILAHRGLGEVNQDGEATGDQIRGGVIGGGGGEIRFGIDAHQYQVAGFGQYSFGSDGLGEGPDYALLVGADLVGNVRSSVEVGPFVAYLRSEDHANLLDVRVAENGAVAGIVVQSDIADGSSFRAVPFMRVGMGLGYYGTKGSTPEGAVVVADYGHLVLLQAGVRIGDGALR